MWKALTAGKATGICKGRSATGMKGHYKQLQSRAGKAEVEPCRKPRPVAKQLESPVEAAARGPKGTEVLKGAGGNLGSVRRNCVHGLHSWKGQLE